MKLFDFTYPYFFKVIQEDNYIPEVITVAGCNWCDAKKPDDKGKLLALTFLTQNDMLTREEVSFQVLLDVDNSEMETIEKCPLLLTNLRKEIQSSYNEIFEDVTEPKEGQYKRSHGITPFVFHEDKKRFVMPVIMKVDEETEEVYIRNIYLSREQYMCLNTYVFAFRVCNWLDPMIFLSGIYKNATSDIEVKSIIYNGTYVLNQNMTYSVFEIYPVDPLQQSFVFVIPTGPQKKNRLLKKGLTEDQFMRNYADKCIAQTANMISVSSPEFRIYLTLRNPKESIVRVYYMDKETVTRLNFFNWDKIIYI